MGLLAAVRRYRGLPASRRALLREALGALVWSRLAMAFLPFRRLASRIEDPAGAGASSLGEEASLLVQEVGWAVQAAAGRVPWDSRCLAQALAAGRMLRRRGLPSVLYLGVRRESASGFSAHAWLRCGPHAVTGGDGSLDHEVLGRFVPGGTQP